MKRQEQLTTETVVITPEMAEEWFIMSGGNRNIRKQHVQYLISEMRDNWKLNGEAIIFDKNGNLIDGHHRLLACAEGKVSFESLVVRGVDPKAKHTIDTGRSRNQADALQFAFKGTVNASAVATTLMRLVEFENGSLQHATAEKISNAVVVKEFSKHPDVGEAVKAVHACRDVVAKTRVAWFYYLMHKQHPAKCEEFFARLADGIELTANNPVYLLRARYLSARRGSTGKGLSSMPLNEAIALLIKAWNSFYRNKTMSVLRWNVRSETFPKIDGI